MQDPAAYLVPSGVVTAGAASRSFEGQLEERAT